MSVKQKRILALKAAIQRYLNSNGTIEPSWIAEYNQLISQ